jgi:outer membrane lipoprotein-sorting protein
MAMVLPAQAVHGNTQNVPLRWRDVVAAYEPVKDYTTVYEKEEQAIDHGQKQTIRLSFRKPLEVRMEWIDNNKVDQIAVYREGFNKGKLLARKTGLLGSVVGTIALDVRDGRAMADSRHPITEVGIGHVIEAIARDMEGGVVEPRPAEPVTLGGAPADKFEFDATTAAPVAGVEHARHASVWVDRALRLPVLIELVDAKGSIVERHRFLNLHTNVGLTDAVFSL